MPSEGKPRARRPDQVMTFPPWLMSRSLCCLGLVLLSQNLLILRWGASMPKGCAISVPLDMAEVEIVEKSEEEEEPVELMLTTATAVSSTTTIGVLEGDSHRAPAVDIVTAAPLSRELSDKNRVDMSGNVVAEQLPTLTLRAMSDAEGERMHNEGGKGPGPKRLKATDSLFTVTRDSLRLFGRKVPDSVVLTIGFGSVARTKDYVLDTVREMFGLKQQPGKPETITAKERSMVLTVGHFADFNLAWVDRISRKVQVEFKDLIEAGHFHGIHAPEELYPRLDFCPPACSYKDEPFRVRWRSKQNIDYAFLMYYAATLAPYYIQLEDDIDFADHWISRIINYIGENHPSTFLTATGTPWRLIDFSQLGFIGKAFQANELTRMAQYLLLFYDQMPCDLLLGDWMLSMGQTRRIDYWKKFPSLFQHVGMFRSLGDAHGFQPLQEMRFGKLVFDNPRATIVWNFTIVPTYEGKFTYMPGGEAHNRNDVCDFKASPKAHKAKIKRCWFWAKSPIKAGDHMTLIFEKPIKLKAAFVEFGHDKHPEDLLHNASVEVADNADHSMPAFLPMGSAVYGACGTFYRLQEVKLNKMVYWEEKVSVPRELPVPQVRCLRIVADRSQDAWAILFQIQIRST